MNTQPIDPLIMNDQAGNIHGSSRSIDDQKARQMGVQSDPNNNKGPSTLSSRWGGGALATQSTPSASGAEPSSLTFSPQLQHSGDQDTEHSSSSSNIHVRAGKQPADSESETANLDANNANPSSSPLERPESSVTSPSARDQSPRPSSNIESEKSSSPQPRSEPSRPNTPLSGADTTSSGTADTFPRPATEEKPEDCRHHDSSIFSVSFHKGNQRILKARTLAPDMTLDQQQVYKDNMMERLSRPQTQADDEVVRKHFPPGHISPLKHVRPDE